MIPDAAHAFDDIDPAERERHLAGCATCRTTAARRAALRSLDEVVAPERSPRDDALFAAALRRAESRRGTTRLVALLAVAAAALLLLRPARPTEPARPMVPPPGPPPSTPATADRAPRWVVRGEGVVAVDEGRYRFTGAPASLSLPDGTILVASGDPRGELVGERGGIARVTLAHGELVVVATPTASRRFAVEHDGWSAWVHGTRFTVRAREGGFELSVSEGDVLVLGPGAPGGMHVVAGQSVVAAGERAPTAPALPALAARTTRGEPARSARFLRDSVQAFGRRDFATAEALCQRYLARWPSGVLAEEALACVMDAQAEQGRRDAARRSAERYLAHYPSGVRSARARELNRSGASGP